MILKNVYIQDLGNGNEVAWGLIYGDEKARFADGTPIRTSIIKDKWDDFSGNHFIWTLNSIYQIEYKEGHL